MLFLPLFGLYNAHCCLLVRTDHRCGLSFSLCSDDDRFLVLEGFLDEETCPLCFLLCDLFRLHRCGVLFSERQVRDRHIIQQNVEVQCTVSQVPRDKFRHLVSQQPTTETVRRIFFFSPFPLSHSDGENHHETERGRIRKRIRKGRSFTCSRCVMSCEALNCATTDLSTSLTIDGRTRSSQSAPSVR